MSSRLGPSMAGKRFAQDGDDLGGVVDRERGLGDEGELEGVGGLDGVGLFGGLDEGHGSGGKLAHGADDFGVAGVADHEDVELVGAAVGVVALGFAVDLRDERAGGVEVEEIAALGFEGDGFRDAVGGEDDGGVAGDFVELFDEDGALGFERLDDGAVVDDLVADIDGGAEAADGLLDDADGAVDAGAEAARARQENAHGLALALGAERRHGQGRRLVGHGVTGLPW